MLTLGIGCRKDCTSEEIITLVRALLAECNVETSDVATLATGWMKSGEVSIIRAASALQLPLRFLPRLEMEAVSSQALTASQHVTALHGIPSVAETAALASAGKQARLLRPRMVSRAAACALASGEGT